MTNVIPYPRSGDQDYSADDRQQTLSMLAQVLKNNPEEIWDDAKRLGICSRRSTHIFQLLIACTRQREELLAWAESQQQQ